MSALVTGHSSFFLWSESTRHRKMFPWTQFEGAITSNVQGGTTNNNRPHHEAFLDTITEFAVVCCKMSRT